MKQRRLKTFHVGVLALFWLSFLVGYAYYSIPIASNNTEPQHDEYQSHRRSLRALVEYFKPHSTVPHDHKTITVYLVEPHRKLPNPAYSIFKTGMLERYGSGRFEYDVKEHTRCDKTCTRPLEDNAPCVVVGRDRDCKEYHMKCNYPKCKTMLVGDESCKARTHDIRGYYSAARGAKAYLPLGPRLDSWTSFRRIQAAPGFVMKKASERKYAFNAVFSQSTNEGRYKLAEIITEQQDKSDLTIFTSFAKQFTSHVNHPRYNKSSKYGQLPTRFYMQDVLDSVFTLAPAGHNPECYRLFEACEAGSIPVLVRRDLTPNYINNCKDALHHWQDAPILVLDTWDDLFPTVERLMEDKEALDEMQLKLAMWYEKHMRDLVGDFENFIFESHTKQLEQAANSVGDSDQDQNVASTDPCDDVVLYVPDNHLSLGKQLNNYILAAMLATFMNKPMVVLDVPYVDFCPDEEKYFHLRFSSLVQIPSWLTRGCAVPCSEKRRYAGWDEFRRLTDNHPMTSCTNDNGNSAHVFVVGGEETRVHFEKHFKDTMQQRSSSVAYEWALRAGAEPQEAAIFTKLEGETMWDYLCALLIRSDVLRLTRLQVVNAVDRYIKKHVFPEGHTKVSYDAIRIRRGEDVRADPEVKWFIDNYWDVRGNYDSETQMAARDYIPLAHYLRHYNSMECSEEIRNVYISTNDPDNVKREIAELGPESNGAILFNNCHNIKFTVSRERKDNVTGGCNVRYSNAIANLADLIVLRKADMLVDEFNSEWGKLTRMFRLVLNEEVGNVAERGIWRPSARLMATQKVGAGSDRSPILLKDTKVVWGSLHLPIPM